VLPALGLVPSDGVALGEALGSAFGSSGPCSASITAMICCSNSVSRPWISESGTSAMCAPYAAICCQRSAIFCMPSSLNGPSRVRNSWVASA
jgi:hypothetical protein